MDNPETQETPSTRHGTKINKTCNKIPKTKKKIIHADTITAPYKTPAI